MNFNHSRYLAHTQLQPPQRKVRVDSLVGDWYTIKTYRTAYAGCIAPAVEHESIELLSSDDSGSQIEVNPPSTRRPPGRPKKSRILSRGEFQLRGTRKRTMCSRCKCYGHNRATCKMPI
ncbi:unnamed protein product [Brassica oleracea]|uniref:(rape) hypothetical protein n=1 Tax=Brassica napus TaxID=3708 RepID=A0A816L3Z0_BRANA|nr:unnamed protein product [Brassica napus]